MPLWREAQPLVLASASAVRRALLTDAGLPVEVAPADIDERAVEAAAGGTRPDAVAALLARTKAADVAQRMPRRVVIGADQVLALGDRRFSKPGNPAAARAQLLALRGKTHALHSAVAVIRDGALLFETVAVARLTMRDFSELFIDAYLDAAGDSVTASVGGYQLERAGIHLFARIEGDHFTILGLPLIPLLDGLRAAGLVTG